MGFLVLHFLVLCTYLIALASVTYVFDPILSVAFDSEFVGTLIFLPHGVRVLATILIGWQAVPTLLVAHIVGYVFIWSPDIDLSVLHAFLLCGVGASCAWIVVAVAKFMPMAPTGLLTANPHWQTVLIVAFISSLINSFGANIVMSLGSNIAWHSFDVRQVIVFIVGDVAGTFALLLIMLFSRKLWRLRAGI